MPFKGLGMLLGIIGSMGMMGMVGMMGSMGMMGMIGSMGIIGSMGMIGRHAPSSRDENISKPQIIATCCFRRHLESYIHKRLPDRVDSIEYLRFPLT